MEDKKKLAIVVVAVIVLGGLAFFSFSRSGLTGEKAEVVGSLNEMEKNSQSAAGNQGEAPKDPSMP